MKTYSCQVISRKTGSTECWTSTIRTANCMPKGYSCMKAKILCSTSLHVWNIFHPDSLHLTNKYEAPDISCTLNADFTGNNIDNLEGSITLDSLSFKTKPDSFFLKKFKVEATGHSLDRHLAITSDVLNGEVTGAYSFTTIVPSLMQTLKGYIPALINVTQKKQKVMENNFSLLLTIENTEAISNTLKLPFTMLTQGRITGHYNNLYNRFRFEAYLLNSTSASPCSNPAI